MTDTAGGSGAMKFNNLWGWDVHTCMLCAQLFHGAIKLRMAIELSGVQFGLKSYAWFESHYLITKFAKQYVFCLYFPAMWLVNL